MVRINNLKADLDTDLAGLKRLAAEKLGVKVAAVRSVRIVKKAVDARNKSRVHFVYVVDAEIAEGWTPVPAVSSEAFEAGDFSGQDEAVPALPQVVRPSFRLVTGLRPVVVGTGPGGMFAALALAEAGLRPVILERGKAVEERLKDVDLFWKTGALKPESNVQFGEGGAGTFSDGKLMTGIKKDAYARKVLKEFVAAGAPEDILYLAKPHIGTDKLAKIVPALRRRIIALGGEYRFENKLVGLVAADGALQAVRVQFRGGRIYEQPCEKLVLAIGHSARDTFEMLYEAGIAVAAKPFSIGARIEHRQEMIDRAQYGSFAGNPHLGAADYKLAVHLPKGRSVYTFCMCPGGEVVAAASEAGRVVTNGMSRYARNAENANAALLVGVTPADYGSSHPLAGMYFQRRLEEAAFQLGGGTYCAPAQKAGDFLKGRISKSWDDVHPSYKPGVVSCDLSRLLPDYVTEAMRAAILAFDRKLHGFAHPEAVLTAPETRSSSPIRILRDENGESLSLKGLFPCGEGAGYAGGIMSAAVDGLRIGEKVCSAAG